MGKCYAYKNILTVDDYNLCLIDTGAKKGRTSTPWGEDHTYQYDECMCVPHLGQGEGWPIIGWWQRVTGSGGSGCPARPHAGCGTAGTFPGSC